MQRYFVEEALKQVGIVRQAFVVGIRVGETTMLAIVSLLGCRRVARAHDGTFGLDQGVTGGGVGEM